MTGRNYKNKGEDFKFDKSCFADDCALLYDNRTDAEVNMSISFNHFLRFGLRIHIGRNGGKSKTEAMYFPASPKPPEELAVSKANIIIADGYITFADSFQYLGVKLVESLDCSHTIQARINKASRAFAGIAHVLCDKHVNIQKKAHLFTAIVQTILLYGSEIWIQKNSDCRAIQTFYNRCVRRMCNITLRKMWRKRISQADLESHLGIKPVQSLIEERRLSYVGHVFRRDHSTHLTRKFLTSWLPKPRWKGGQRKTYGATVKDALKKRNLDLDKLRKHLNNGAHWYRYRCGNRVKWRQFCKGSIQDSAVRDGEWITTET